MMRRRSLLGGAAAALVSACAEMPKAPSAAAANAAGASPAEPVFAPNANLFVQGIPPIPMSLVQRVAAYTDFRGHGFADWHPQRREMLVAHREAGANVPQLYRVSGPGATPERLTSDAEPVSRGQWEPAEGRYLVFGRSAGGNEATQLFRLDPATREAVRFTDPDQRHDMEGWLHGGRRLLVASQPLDRTAGAGRRSDISTTLWLVDPLQPEGRRQLAELPGGGWGVGALSLDDRQIALINYRSATQSELWLLDLAGGAPRRVLPAAGDSRAATHFAAAFTPDGRGLFFISDRAGEFRELMHLDLASGAIERLSAQVPWDVSGVAATHDGRRLAVQFNVEGRDELRLFDAITRRELPAPVLPPGSVGSAAFHPRTGEIAFSLNGAQGPSQLYTLAADGGAVQRWTTAYSPPGVDPRSFGDQSIVRWPSFDGRSISGLITRPPARFSGRRPVLIDVHGGPEGQATVGFLGRYNFYVQEMGFALLQPNVRGSSGFGKTFLSLDDGMKREDSVKDIGALLDWIAAQPDLDPARVVVMGGSYGGYMSLAVSVHYAERILGAVDDVGISHFVTFLQNTESYRRDLRRAEYGDERDPAMRAFLDRISPLTNAHRIRKPLFVVQGRNDPRVPWTEAEQIVERARANGTPVWYLRGENEGHGFARKENADFRFYAVVRFLETLMAR